MRLKDLRERRAKHVAEMQRILDAAKADSNRELTEAERRSFDTAELEARRLGDVIRRVELELDEDREALERGERGDPIDYLAGGNPRAIRARHQRATERGRTYRDTATGREIRALGPDESLCDFVLEQRSAPALPDNMHPSEFDVGRLLRGLTTGHWEGAERERRAMSTGDFTAGGALLPQPVAAFIIDLARKRARVIQAGARTIPIPGAELRVARIDSDVSAGWRHENVPISVSEPAIGDIVFRPKTLGCLVPLSQELVEDAPNAGAVVEQSIAAAIALELDRVCLYGNAAPGISGLATYPGVQQLTSIGALTAWTDLAVAWQSIITANGPENGLAAITSTREAAFYDTLADTLGQPLMPPPSVAAMRRYPTTQVSVTDGAGTESSMFVGDFSQLLIGVRTELTIEVQRGAHEPTSGLGFGSLSVWIRGYMRADIGVGRAAHLVRLSGIT